MFCVRDDDDDDAHNDYVVTKEKLLQRMTLLTLQKEKDSISFLVIVIDILLAKHWLNSNKYESTNDQNKFMG